jgi:hypothetical protein
MASVLALLGGACGSSGSSPNCDGGCWHPTAADETFMEAFCGLSEACCVANGLRPQADTAACKARFQTSGFTRDEPLRSSCLAEIQRLAGTQSCVPEVWDLDSPCVRTFDEPSGPRSPGQDCTVRADCAGSAGTVTTCSRDPSDPALVGSICVQLRRAAAGDHPCLGNALEDGLINAAPVLVSPGAAPISTGFVCEVRDGVHCDFETDTCVPFVADGSACTYLTSCASGRCLTASLDEATSGTPGTCASVVTAGQRCTGVASACDRTSYCDASESGLCVPRLSAGSPCATDDMCMGDNCRSMPGGSGECSVQTSAEALALLAFCGPL